MGENRKNANQRRLEHLRAVRSDLVDGPSMAELNEQQAARIADLEAEVERLRSLLDALKPPRPERGTSSGSSAQDRQFSKDP